MNTIKRTLIVALMLLGTLNTVNAAEQFQAGTEEQKVIASKEENPKVILSLSNGKKLPLKQREFNRMGFIKNLIEAQDTTQEANEPLEIPLNADRVTPEAGTLLIHLMENVLGDQSYENIPEIEAINSNKKIVEKHLNVLTDKKRLAGNAHKFNLLKELYKAVDYLNVQLLKTEAQNITSQASADNALQELIAHEAAHSLLASDFGSVDLNINHNDLHEQLKLEMAQRYGHEQVLLDELSFNGHQGQIRGAQLSRNGTTLMTHSEDKVIVRNAQTGAVLFTVNRGDAHGHQWNIRGAQLSADGNTLMTHSWDKVMVHNIQTGAVVYIVHRRDADGHQEFIRGAQLSPDGTTLMTQSLNKVMVHNAQTSALLFTVAKGDINGHQEDISDARLSPDGNILTTRSKDKVMVHNAQTSAVLYIVNRGDADGHQENIRDAQLSLNGTTLMTHSEDKVIVRNAQTGAVLYIVDRGDADGHQWNIDNAQLIADGNALITYSNDKVMVHNTQTGAVSSCIVTGRDAYGHEALILGAQLSPYGNILITHLYNKVMPNKLPITAHSIQKPLSKFITQINNGKKTISIYQQDFIEEIVRDLSLEQIYAAVHAKNNNQNYPKIVITPTTNAQALGVNVEFVEGLQDETEVKNTQPVASSSND